MYTDEIFIYCIACSRHSEGGAWAKNKVSEKKKRRIRESRERIQSPLSPLLLLLIFLLTLLPGHLNPLEKTIWVKLVYNLHYHALIFSK